MTTVLASAATSFHRRLKRSGEDGLAVIELGDHVLIGQRVDLSSMRKVILALKKLDNSSSPSVVGHPGEALARCELHQVGVRWRSWLRLQWHAFPGVVVLRLQIEKENLMIIG